jgi:hypothetical protein
MALGLALLEKGWELEAQPGSFFLGKGADRINTFALMDELIEGETTAEGWAGKCKELGIVELELTFAAGNAPTSS